MIDIAISKLNDIIEKVDESGDKDQIKTDLEELMQILEYAEGY